MKKLIILLLLPFGLKAQTLTTAQLTARLLIADSNITAINKKLSGIYNTLDSYKIQIGGIATRTGILEAMPKDSIKVDKGLTLSNKVISLDTSFTDVRYLSSILQLALFYSNLDKKIIEQASTIENLTNSTILTFNGVPIGKELNVLTKTLETKLENAIGRLILLEEFRKALKNL